MALSDYLTLNVSGSQGALGNLTIESPVWIRFEPILNNHTLGMNISAHVAQAASKKLDLPSSVQVSLYFLIVVVLFGLLKLAVMTTVLLTDRSAYLVTLGDAAASFLKRPDPYTAGKCILGRQEILISMGHSPSHDNSDNENTQQLRTRLDGIWLPSPVRYFFPVHQGTKFTCACLLVIPTKFSTRR
jgi:hypothetical protein